MPMTSAAYWLFNRIVGSHAKRVAIKRGKVESLGWFPLFFAVTNPMERVDNTGDDISGMTGNALQETGVQ